MVDVDPDNSSAEHDPAEKPKRHKRSFWRELPILLVVALGLATLIQVFLGRIYMIPSESMEQTLHGCSDCYGDRVLVDKVTYDFSDPSPGEVVVFRGPQSWQNDFVAVEPGNFVSRGLQKIGTLVGLPAANEEDFVKRVIAVPGQKVMCCDDRNHVLVDGKPLDEPYVYFPDGGSTVQDSFGEMTIPPGALFVLGDNRNDSCDSRCQGGGGQGGLVPIDNVIGKARLIVLPPGRWQRVSSHNPQVVAMGAPGWQDGAPMALGIVAAWPVLLLGRSLRRRLRP